MGSDALDMACIQAGLSPFAQQTLAGIHLFTHLDSTNRWALQHGQCAEAYLAEQQTAGRGRRGKVWESPAGVNLYLSLRWCFAKVPACLPVLSLVTGVAVAEALEDCAIRGHGLKWPNDLYHDGKKLGGILLEAVGSLDQVVIGIGLNVNMLPDAGSRIDQPWTSLQAMEGGLVARNPLVIAILNRLLGYLQHFSQLDMAQFQSVWRRWDVLEQRPVRVLSGTEILEGLACGIDSQGQLRLKLNDGSIRNFSSADVSVRM
jgi:BirA family biotin operon repressor/biotin-[acetyl-CoA-carboxylase] ligase